MKARELISGTSYGPDTLRIVFRSFDEAWDSIEADFGHNPLAIQAARVKLANIILSIPHHPRSDAEQIKNSALQLMALDHRTGRISG
jgi:hypothetical protein